MYKNCITWGVLTTTTTTPFPLPLPFSLHPSHSSSFSLHPPFFTFSNSSTFFLLVEPDFSTPWWIAYWWEWIGGSCHDLTQAVISFYCVMLQETEWGHHSCHFVVVLIYEVATWYVLLCIVTNLPWYAVHCNRINQGFKPYAAKLCVFSSEWFHQHVHC